MSSSLIGPYKCILCMSDCQQLVSIYTSPPNCENTFGIQNYYRELWQCKICGLFSNLHRYDLSQIYDGLYGQTAYDYGSAKSRFDSIMNLPADKSDNRGRVSRIISYIEERYTDLDKNVLDIGCGMAVFPAVMREHGWSVTAIDPNYLSVEHAEKLAKVKGIVGSFPSVVVPQKYALITFNKVLEHIQNLIECLSAAKLYLAEGGVVYIELPDGEMAIEAGPDRQEFFLEHYYAFGFASLALLAKKAGYCVQRIARVIEPSGKRTIFAFLNAHYPVYLP